MDKKGKVFFAAMGIATALLVSVSASADNSDSKVQVSIDITWDSLEFTYTDRQWDPETHSYKGGGWSDSGGNFTLTNTGNVGVMADFSYKQAEGMDEIKGYFSSSELIVPSSNKIVEKKFVRIGEASMTYSIGHHRFIEMARAAGAVYKIGTAKGNTILINLEIFDDYMEQFREPPTEMKHPLPNVKGD